MASDLATVTDVAAQISTTNRLCFSIVEKTRIISGYRIRINIGNA